MTTRAAERLEEGFCWLDAGYFASWGGLLILDGILLLLLGVH